MSHIAKSEIRKKARSISPRTYLDYRELFRDIRRVCEQVSPKMTHGQFSELLGFPSSNIMDHIIKGRRPLSTKNGDRIAKALQYMALDRDYLIALVEYNNSGSPKKKDVAFERLIQLKEKGLANELSKEKLEFFSEWFHITISEMVRLQTFQSDPAWIAKNICPNIRPEQARKSLALLERLGIIYFDPDSNRHRRTPKDPSTSQETAGHAIRSYHKQMIDISKGALAYHSQKRDVSATTITIDEPTMLMIKKEIHRLQRQIMELDQQCQSQDAVYQLNVQFFPLSK